MIRLSLRTTDLTAGVVETLAVNEDRLRQALDAGFSQATDLADELMLRCGLDYRRSYRVAGRALRILAEHGRSARELTPDVLDAAAVEILGEPLSNDPGDLSPALDPDAIVATRTAVGGAAPAAVEEMADEIESRRALLVTAAEAHLTHFDAAEATLRKRCRALAGGDTTDVTSSQGGLG